MTPEGKIAFIVDDDTDFCAALSGRLRSLGLCPIRFECAAAHLAFPKPNLPACLLLDVELPDINGLDLQERMVDDVHPPIIFITGHGDIPSSVRAMKLGAVDFLTKPFSDAQLIKAVDAAIEQDKKSRSQRAEQTMLRQHFSSLTPREREVFPLVVSGLLNAQAAAELVSANSLTRFTAARSSTR
jgi:FixJ family two-component response regulator